MSLTINQFLSNLKNASLIQKTILTIKFNQSFLPILKILYNEGFILNFVKDHTKLVIKLRYYCNSNNLKKLKIISRISRPVYLNKLDIFRICEKNRLLIFSTPHGLLTSLECKKLKTGGELVFIC